MPFPPDLISQMTSFLLNHSQSAARAALEASLSEEKRAAFREKHNVRREFLDCCEPSQLCSFFPPDEWKTVLRLTEKTLVDRLTEAHRRLDEAERYRVSAQQEEKNASAVVERHRENLRAIFDL